MNQPLVSVLIANYNHEDTIVVDRSVLAID